MKKKTKIITFITMLFLLAFAVPLTGSAASPKAQVKKSVNTFMKYAKNMNTVKMNQCLVEQEETGTAAVPNSAAFNKILRPYARKLSWKIKSCTVKGSKATVKLRVNYANLHVSYRNMMEEVMEYVTTDFDASVNSTIRRMAKWMKQEAAKNGSETGVYENLTVKLKKTGGKWKIMGASEELVDAVYCGIMQGMYEYMDEAMAEADAVGF